jgi:hypothetical protein
MLDAGYLDQLRDNAAGGDCKVAACPSCGRQLIFRCWAGVADAADNGAALEACLDGLAELQRTSGITAYGLWMLDVPEDADPNGDWLRDHPGRRQQLWLAAGRKLITEGPCDAVLDALAAHPCPAAT